MKKTHINLVTGLIIGLSLSGIGTYAATTYAISANKIAYSDNSSLGVDNVQAAIDGTCTKFDEQLTNLKSDIVDTMYPVGSIYTSETDSTVASVQNRFKAFGKETTWEIYSQGKVLVGSGTGTDSNGTTQTFSVSNNSKNLGEYNHTLSIAEMPSHTHIQNAHYHEVGFDNNGIHYIGSSPGGTAPSTSAYLTNLVGGARDYTMIAKSVVATNQYTGEDQPHNNIQPYTTVYMYKRIK